MTTMELFLRLVRNALWQTEEELPEELSANISANILRGGKEQGLLGLVNDALRRNKVRMPEKQYLELMVMLVKVKQSNELVNEGLRRLKELFDNREIDYVVVKGQAVGAYYPDPILRQAGDIDYYCDAYNFPKALDAVKKEWGVEAGTNGSLRHIHYEYNDVSYEGHFILTSFYSKRINSYWEQFVNSNDNLNEASNLNDNGNLNGSERVRVKVRVNGMEVRTLPPTIHAIYIFVHLYDHLLNLGVGFRQFCDLAVILHRCHDEIDHERMREILKTLGMERAFRVIGCILTDSLGMPKDDFPYELTKSDRRFGRLIFNIVRHRGNLGHYNIKNESGWRNNIEMKCIKLSHFLKLLPLAPGYNCRWFIHMIKKKF